MKESLRGVVQRRHRHKLNEADAPVGEPSDDAFVENSFHSKPGFGGSDALRCICQNPDEPFWPDGHADDDDVEF